MPQKSALDCEYVRNVSFRLDIRLIFVTLMLVFVPARLLSKKLRLFGREVWGYSRIAQMVLDLLVYASAIWCAYNFWFETGIPAFYRVQMWMFLITVPAIRVIVQRRLGVYDMMWRYINVEDAIHLALAFAPVSIGLLSLRLGLRPLSGFTALFMAPLGVITLEYLITLTAGLGLRSLRRMLYAAHHHYQPLPEAARRVLILGAGMMGMTTAIEMRHSPHLRLVGFLDDDPSKYRRLLVGSRVLGNTSEVETLCAQNKITDIIICSKSMSREKAADLRRRCGELGVKLHSLPTLEVVMNGKAASAAA